MRDNLLLPAINAEVVFVNEWWYDGGLVKAGERGTVILSTNESIHIRLQDKHDNLEDNTMSFYENEEESLNPTEQFYSHCEFDHRIYKDENNRLAYLIDEDQSYYCSSLGVTINLRPAKKEMVLIWIGDDDNSVVFQDPDDLTSQGIPIESDGPNEGDDLDFVGVGTLI